MLNETYADLLNHYGVLGAVTSHLSVMTPGCLGLPQGFAVIRPHGLRTASEADAEFDLASEAAEFLRDADVVDIALNAWGDVGRQIDLDPDRGPRKSAPRLRSYGAKSRLYRFVFCEQGARFHNFTEIAPSFHSRFRRNGPLYSAKHRSRDRWEYLCGFDLLRHADRSAAWLSDVENQYVQDQGSYGRSFRKPHASNRSVAALRAYWCGKNGSVPRIAFSAALKKRLIRSLPCPTARTTKSSWNDPCRLPEEVAVR